MSLINVVVVALTLTAALASIAVLASYLPTPDGPGRSGPIDGLRGYLALFVFLHHAAHWQVYLQTGAWTTPSTLFTHLGQGSVALFFMITAFLFFSKLLDGRSKQIDWLRLLISRLLRLAPLYLFVVALMFCVVAVESAGRLTEPASRLLHHAASWLAFTIAGAPALNNITQTWQIVAGVTWSLPYEWLFYASLPVLALLTRSAVTVWQVAFSVVAVAVIGWLAKPLPVHLLAFAGGISAALLATSTMVRAYCSKRTTSILIVACLATLVTLFPSTYGNRPTLLLTFVFIAIACGNGLFGALTSRLSRTLGEITYSIYLLHGLLLYVVFRFVIGFERAAALSPLTYWLVIMGLTPVLLGLCTWTFLHIEQPALLHTNRLTGWLRSQRSHQPPVATSANA